MTDPLSESALAELVRLSQRVIIARKQYSAAPEPKDPRLWEEFEGALASFESNVTSAAVYAAATELQALRAERERFGKIERDYCWMFGEHKDDPCPCGYRSKAARAAGG